MIIITSLHRIWAVSRLRWQNSTSFFFVFLLSEWKLWDVIFLWNYLFWNYSGFLSFALDKPFRKKKKKKKEELTKWLHAFFFFCFTTQSGFIKKKKSQSTVMLRFFTAASGDADCYSCLLPAHRLQIDAVWMKSLLHLYQFWHELLGVSPLPICFFSNCCAATRNGSTVTNPVPPHTAE